MATSTSMSGPVHLGEPVPEAAPVPGCDVCAALDKQRETARQADDLTKVVEINVELRRHPHGERSER